jgi:hypothetical protein
LYETNVSELISVSPPPLTPNTSWWSIRRSAIAATAFDSGQQWTGQVVEMHQGARDELPADQVYQIE